MSVVRSVLVAAAVLQAALLGGGLVALRSIRSRFMRWGMALTVIAAALATAAVLASLWADRPYDVPEYALAGLTLAWSVAEVVGVTLLVRYIGTQQVHDDELQAATVKLLEHPRDLERSRDFYLRLFDDFPALIWRSDTAAQRDYFNRAWLKFRGRTTEDEQCDGWASGVHPDDLDRCMAIWLRAFEMRRPFDMEYRLLNAKCAYRWIADHGQPFFDTGGDFLGYMGSCYDITASREQAGQLAYLADHDTLTGLANRRVLQAALERAFVRAQRGVPSILMYIDVDHFKSINDRLGHPAGDSVLISVAHLLTAGVRTTDVVARLAGDKFGVLLEMIETEEAVTIAQRLVADACEHLADTGLSIGVASMEDATDITEVMRRADERMNEAKNGGGSRVVVDIRAIHRT